VGLEHSRAFRETDAAQCSERADSGVIHCKSTFPEGAYQAGAIFESAGRSGVDLSVLTERVIDVNATPELIRQMKADGLIAIGMDFQREPWPAFCR